MEQPYQNLQRAERVRLPFDAVQRVPFSDANDAQSDLIQYKKYIVSGMTCAACAARVEKVIRRIPSVTSVHVNLSSERAFVRGDARSFADADVLASIQKAGYDAFVETEEQADIERQRKLSAYESLWNRWFLAFVLMLSLMSDMFVSMKIGHPALPTWCGWTMATIVQMLLGGRVYKGAFHALRGKAANMDVLVSLASGVAYIQSTVLAIKGAGMASFNGAAMVLVMITFGNLIEQRAKQRISSIVASQTQTSDNVIAHKRRQGKRSDTHANLLVPGDEIFVSGSEIVPTDVVISAGRAALDESVLTGESHPVEKRAGDVAYGGTRNLSTAWTGRVLRTTDNTLHAHMVQMIERAQMNTSTSRSWIDAITAIFVPVVVLISLLACGYHLWLYHAADQAITNAIAVLVAACPCALGLATPTALAVGLQIGLKHGVCLQDENSLRRLSKVDTVILDKTGTLTTGKLCVQRIDVRRGNGEQSVLALAAAAEDGVDHPVARAIVTAALEQNLLWTSPKEPAHEKRGVTRSIQGHQIRVCPPSVEPQHLPFPTSRWTDQSNPYQLRCVDVLKDNLWMGRIWLSDEIRSDAAELVQTLQKRGIDVQMLTGDSIINAQYVASTLNIPTYKAQLDAADKVRHISELQQSGRTVAMIGDGINDAAAIQSADVGIAFGASAPESLLSSDVAIVNGSLRHLLWSVRLAHGMLLKIRQNLTWALFYNAISIPLAFFGLIRPMWAGIGMALSSVIVMSNSLLLQNWQNDMKN